MTELSSLSLRLAAISLLGVSSLIACGGSMKASASAKASTDGGAQADANFDAEGSSGDGWDEVEESQSAEETQAQTAAAAPPPPAEIPLLGARHDLLLREGSAATCKCLSVLIGPPNTAGMIWTGRQPAIDVRSQLVVALGSEGVSCAEGGPGASYMGYEVKDGNVVVNVEAAVEGRPVTHGAIIPKPAQGKQILIQGNGNVPYGKSLNGEGSCAFTPQ